MTLGPEPSPNVGKGDAGPVEAEVVADEHADRQRDRSEPTEAERWRAEYRLDAARLREVQQTPPFRRARRQLTVFAALAGLTHGLTAACYWRSAAPPTGPVEMGLLASAALAGCFLWFVWRRSRALLPADLPPQQLEASLRGIFTSSSDGWSFWGWPLVSEIAEHGRFVIVSLPRLTVLPLPKDDLPEPQPFLAGLRRLHELSRSGGPAAGDFSPPMPIDQGTPLAAVDYFSSHRELLRWRQTPLVTDSATTSSAAAGPRSVQWRLVLALTMVFLTLFLLLATGDQGMLEAVGRFLAALLAPLIAVGLVTALYARWVNRSQGGADDEPFRTTICLYVAGVLVSRPHQQAFTRWRHWRGVAQNERLLALLGPVLHEYAPRAAFSSPAAADDFFSLAKQLHREAHERRAEGALPKAGAAAADLTNPYAAPRPDDDQG